VGRPKEEIHHTTSVLRACSWQMGLEMIGKNDGIEDASLRDA